MSRTEGCYHTMVRKGCYVLNMLRVISSRNSENEKLMLTWALIQRALPGDGCAGGGCKAVLGNVARDIS